jgi:peptidoglycan biosynthesis protein MviN/MurJ (putative lipid II flippase)
MLAGPASIAVIAYLWAIGDARTPLHASIALAISWPVLAAILMPATGSSALGIAFVVGSVVFVGVLRRGAARDGRLDLVRAACVPTLAWLVGAGVGYWVAHTLDATVPTAVAAGGVAVTVYVVCLGTFWRTQLAELAPLVVQFTRRRPLLASGRSAEGGA